VRVDEATWAKGARRRPNWPPTGKKSGGSPFGGLYRWRGKEPPVDRISVEMAEHFWWIDSSKAERELGFAQRDPQLTLVDTVSYLRQGVDLD